MSHTYADDGVYRITVTVADDDGATVAQSIRLFGGQRGAGVKVSGPASVREGLVYHLTPV